MALLAFANKEEVEVKHGSLSLAIPSTYSFYLSHPRLLSTTIQSMLRQVEVDLTALDTSNLHSKEKRWGKVYLHLRSESLSLSCSVYILAVHVSLYVQIIQ